MVDSLTEIKNEFNDLLKIDPTDPSLARLCIKDYLHILMRNVYKDSNYENLNMDPDKDYPISIIPSIARYNKKAEKIFELLREITLEMETLGDPYVYEWRK